MALTSGGPYSVVPTHVGVFLHRDALITGEGCCPHTRGGVPNDILQGIEAVRVVPTHVGVFRSSRKMRPQRRRCPHTIRYG